MAPDLTAHELDGATLSPDGTELVVSMRNADGKYDLWRATTDGPVLSPDGNWLAYSSNVSGRREIYVRPFPETGRGVYQVSTEGGIAPRWSRRGGELFYIDGRERMIGVPVRTGSGFETGEQRVLFDASRYQHNPYHQQYDLSADDTRFLMIRGQAGNATNVVVVFGFLDELRRAMDGR